jgi:1-acyl-sn-glycerol-3-phosphate acyltransferase
MMKLAGDIPVDRSDRRSGARMLLTSMWYLDQRCSVMFFPEGTRSPDGTVGKFNDGAFHLAIKAQVPILPVAIEGSYGCLPKRSWMFGKPSDVYVQVLPEIGTSGLTLDDLEELNATVRKTIVDHVLRRRNVIAKS